MDDLDYLTDRLLLRPLVPQESKSSVVAIQSPQICRGYTPSDASIVTRNLQAVLRDLSSVSTSDQALLAAARYLTFLVMGHQQLVEETQKSVAQLQLNHERELDDLLSRCLPANETSLAEGSVDGIHRNAVVVDSTLTQTVFERHAEQLAAETRETMKKVNEAAASLRLQFSDFLRSAADDVSAEDPLRRAAKVASTKNQEGAMVGPLATSAVSFIDAMAWGSDPVPVSRMKVANPLKNDYPVARAKDPALSALYVDISPVDALERCLAIVGREALLATKKGKPTAATATPSKSSQADHEDEEPGVVDLEGKTTEKMCVALKRLAANLAGSLVLVGDEGTFDEPLYPDQAAAVAEDTKWEPLPGADGRAVKMRVSTRLWGANLIVRIETTPAGSAAGGSQDSRWFASQLGSAIKLAMMGGADMFTLALAQSAPSSCVSAVAAGLTRALAQTQMDYNGVRLPNPSLLRLSANLAPPPGVVDGDQQPQGSSNSSGPPGNFLSLRLGPTHPTAKVPYNLGMSVRIFVPPKMFVDGVQKGVFASGDAEQLP